MVSADLEWSSPDIYGLKTYDEVGGGIYLEGRDVEREGSH